MVFSTFSSVGLNIHPTAPLCSFTMTDLGAGLLLSLSSFLFLTKFHCFSSGGNYNNYDYYHHYHLNPS